MKFGESNTCRNTALDEERRLTIFNAVWPNPDASQHIP
jgi:hypothetical protein